MSKIKSFDSIMDAIKEQSKTQEGLKPVLPGLGLRKKEALIAIDGKLAKADIELDKAIIDFENVVAGFEVRSAAGTNHTIDTAAMAVEVAEATLTRYQKLRNALFPAGSTSGE